MYPDLTGKTAVVTGASSGLGHGIAQRFLQQEGMNVVVNYHSEKHRGAAQELADACNANGRTVAVVVQADISQEEGAQKLLDAALDAFGTVDVWVNNAGIESRYPTHELPLEEWEKVLAVNLTGVFLGSAGIVTGTVIAWTYGARMLKMKNLPKQPEKFTENL